MKRLDMVKELMVWMEENGLLPEEEHTPGDNGYTANMVLSILEEFGMTPPAIKEPCPTYYQNAMGQVQQGEDSFVFVHRWEDET